MNKILKTAAAALILGTAFSCSRDFVDREFYQTVQQAPLTSLTEVQAFTRGLYASMRASTYYGRDYLAYAEMRSDEMASNGASGYYETVRSYTMTSSDGYAAGTYNQIYTMIGKANILIGTNMDTLNGSDLEKAQARFNQGQAYALRAQGFFDLLRLYGQKYTGNSEQLGIVLPLTYDPKASKGRSTVAETEAQIEADFNKALTMMTANASYDVPSNKVELSLSALRTLMARFYLYKGNYAKVREMTNAVVGKYSVATRDLLQPTFDYTLRGAAPNAIFELEVGTDSSLGTASYDQMLNTLGYRNLYVLTTTYALYATNDIRRNLITANGSNYFLSVGARGKYLNRTGADNIKLIRYEEVLLNGAEAELNGGDPAKALDYYKQILVNRLGPIPNGSTTITAQQQVDAITAVTLDMIKVERRKELLGEGFRMWDLLRWGNKSFKPASISDNLLAFPIPRSETDIANTPVKSNPGYDN